MSDDKKFENHLLTIEPQSWERLFKLLPEIESTKEFGELLLVKKLENGSFQMPYFVESEIVREFVHIFCEINLCVVFDWGRWTERKEILEQQENFDFSKLDTLVLCKILTTIIRADRFCDGFLISYFDNGTIAKIIKAIQQNVYRK